MRFVRGEYVHASCPQRRYQGVVHTIFVQIKANGHDTESIVFLLKLGSFRVLSGQIPFDSFSIRAVIGPRVNANSPIRSERPPRVGRRGAAEI